MKKDKANKTKNTSKKMTRKQAIKKAGKYAALTATSMLILSPKESQAGSISPTAPGAGW